VYTFHRFLSMLHEFAGEVVAMSPHSRWPLAVGFVGNLVDARNYTTFIK